MASLDEASHDDRRKKEARNMPAYLKEHNGVFCFHPPKTGGTSLSAYLREDGWAEFHKDESSVSSEGNRNWYRRVSPQHEEAAIANQTFSLSKFDLVITTVRNPIDRVVSEFFYRNQSVGASSGNLEKLFRAWWEDNSGRYNSNSYILDNHLRPQYEFVSAESKIIYFERDLNEGQLGDLFADHGLTPPKAVFPHLNRRSKVPFKLSRQTKASIELFYAIDYEKFGY